MHKIMADIAIRPMIDIDRDFVAAMVPHHRGAIEMVLAELLCGYNQTLLRALTDVPDAMPSDDSTQNLVLPSLATHGAMAAPGDQSSAPTSVTLFNQGLYGS